MVSLLGAVTESVTVVSAADASDCVDVPSDGALDVSSVLWGAVEEPSLAEVVVGGALVVVLGSGIVVPVGSVSVSESRGEAEPMPVASSAVNASTA